MCGDKEALLKIIEIIPKKLFIIVLIYGITNKGFGVVFLCLGFYNLLENVAIIGEEIQIWPTPGTHCHLVVGILKRANSTVKRAKRFYCHLRGHV